MSDLKTFSHSLSEGHKADLAASEVADAFHNLTSFMSVLIKVNEREQVVPTKRKGNRNENQ